MGKLPTKLLPLVLVLAAQGASGWLGVSPLARSANYGRTASATLGNPFMARRRPARHSSGVRAAGVTSVRSMILGEKPVIENTGLNSRRISASIIIARPPEDVWRILTDYDNLSTHVPNLIASKRVPHPGGARQIRLFQEGAQKIWGFDFSASLVMDMEELFGPEQEHRRLQRKIRFKLIQSAMLAKFDGEWALQPHSRQLTQPSPEALESAKARGMPRPEALTHYSTKLIYSVNVTPRGMVPVPAIEWRVREDVPLNLRAVKTAVELLPLRPVDQLISDEQMRYAARP
ncbi:hypothetical protein T492DRAFT_1077581 [Pavlovales sp. CCMP2436]|nr:hypothetical protein T492DRAFT_1077581 [Pavlovales sp. CCMP2436]